MNALSEKIHAESPSEIKPLTAESLNPLSQHSLQDVERPNCKFWPKLNRQQLFDIVHCMLSWLDTRSNPTLHSLPSQIYFMCSTEICSPRDGPCVEGCFGQWRWVNWPLCPQITHHTFVKSARSHENTHEWAPLQHSTLKTVWEPLVAAVLCDSRMMI